MDALASAAKAMRMDLHYDHKADKWFLEKVKGECCQTTLEVGRIEVV